MAALANQTLLAVAGLHVWHSGDGGSSWTPSATSPGFVPRMHASMLVLSNGTVVMMGGAVRHASSGQVLNDVVTSADRGLTWRVSSAAWSPRAHMAAALLPDGVTVIVAGGMEESGTLLNDVWSSSDGGDSWTLVAETTLWERRCGHVMVSLPSGAVLVMGGQSSHGAANDVWKSVNAGTTFTQLDPAPWTPRYAAAAVSIGGAVVVTGGTNGVTSARDVWVSTDAATTWTLATASPPWSAMHGHTMAVSPSGTLTMAGGTPSSNDVWTSAPVEADARWYSADCDEHKRGLCSAFVGSVGVTVALPAAAGAVSPSNAASSGLQLASAVYRPPAPTIIPTGGQGSYTHDSTLQFLVAFSEPVSGLRAGDFVVLAGEGRPHVSLVGAGTSWTLTVSVDVDTVPNARCPVGYTRSAAPASWCARVTHALRTWAAANDACAPYTLASVSSEGQQRFLSTLDGDDNAWRDGHWYVAAPM